MVSIFFSIGKLWFNINNVKSQFTNGKKRNMLHYLTTKNHVHVFKKGDLRQDKGLVGTVIEWMSYSWLTGLGWLVHPRHEILIQSGI